MKTAHVLMLTAFAAAVAAAAPLLAQEGRMLDTMPHGVYQCSLPGDADGEAYKVVKSAEFEISTASRYTSAKGSGTYLLKGREFVFTKGPRKGERYKRLGPNQLQRRSEDGSLGKLLCTRIAR
ncbi:MAG: elongation factor P [Pseudomonadota bacterium]|nr:elongation factor P [Pseudomonadota bacterium]